jgi:hypothetical protein
MRLAHNHPYYFTLIEETHLLTFPKSSSTWIPFKNLAVSDSSKDLKIQQFKLLPGTRVIFNM